jgi:hypothetical protein
MEGGRGCRAVAVATSAHSCLAYVTPATGPTPLPTPHAVCMQLRCVREGRNGRREGVQGRPGCHFGALLFGVCYPSNRPNTPPRPPCSVYAAALCERGEMCKDGGGGQGRPRCHFGITSVRHVCKQPSTTPTPSCTMHAQAKTHHSAMWKHLLAELLQLGGHGHRNLGGQVGILLKQQVTMQQDTTTEHKRGPQKFF